MATMKFRGMRHMTIAALVAAGFALSACGDGGGTTGGAAPTVGGQVSGDLNILVSSATGSDAGFKAVTKAFNTKYPNVKVNFSAVPNENYNQTRSSRLTAGSVDIVVAFPREVPDYVPAANAGDDARLADSGGFLDLTGQPFLKSFNQSVLDGTRYKGKHYTVPTGQSYYTGMFYNKKIFADNGINVPTTWQELMAACDKLKAKGIVPVGIAGKDSAGVTTLGVVQGLYGYAQPNFAGITYQTMTADFVNGKFAMMGDGTWNTTSIQTAGGSKLDFGYFPLPSSDNAQDNKFLGGKVELSLAIPANAKNPTAAIAWLDTFAKNYKLFNDQAGFAPAVTGVKGNAFYDTISDATSTFQPAWDTIWIANTKAGPAASVPFNWAGVKPMGTTDAAGAAAAAQKDWEAGLNK